MHATIKRSMSCTFAFLTAVCLQSGHAGANPFPRPLAVTNQTPLAGIFGIPEATGVEMLGEGNTQWTTNLAIASHFNGATRNNESILIDGETSQFSLQMHHGINDHWNIGVEIPWVHHGGGSLDSFIINWHDLWGFPQNGRDEARRNQIAYRYERNGVPLVDIDATTRGIGDVIFSAQRELVRGEGHASVVHTQIKLPTGDADKLTGSGGVDVSAGVELMRQWRPGWHTMMRGGVTYIGEGDVLPDLKRRWAAYGGFEVSWRPLDALALRLQFSAHTSPYQDTRLDALSKWSGLLAMGGTWYLSQKTALDLSLIEDVPNTDTVSDVTLQIRLRTRLGNNR